MKNLLVTLCAASAVIATPALACAPFYYAPTVADARVLARNGNWRTIHIEALQTRLRLEYRSPASPTGRVAVVGEVEDQFAYWFPITATGEPLSNAFSQKTTWKSTLAAVGLPPKFITQPSPGVFIADPRDSGAAYFSVQRWLGQKCELETETLAKDDGRPGEVRLCIPPFSFAVNGYGLPLYAIDANSKRVFEVTKVSNVRVSDARLQVPATRLAAAGCGAG